MMEREKNEKQGKKKLERVEKMFVWGTCIAVAKRMKGRKSRNIEIEMLPRRWKRNKGKKKEREEETQEERCRCRKDNKQREKGC
jgi:hypothetical protein